MTTVLFVDDEPQHTHSMVEELEDAGYDVIQIDTDGSDAMNAIDADSGIALIVLDIMMPTGDRIDNTTDPRRTGLRVAEYVRQQLKSRIPIIFFTVIEDPSVHREIERLERASGMKRPYIMVKPVAPLELVAQVQQLIGVAG
jgi:CheY-like chemotaxis protein